ncbi:DUF1711-domain-containing protein [Podospora conica]|nr:DUF1711-domain-containing protein [Schizothecium conicum]
MAPSAKSATAAKDRRKSGQAPASVNPTVATLVITLKVKPHKLRLILQPDSAKEDTPMKDVKVSPAPSATLPVAPNSNSNGENASDSTPDTPAAGTPAPQPNAMGPPAEGPKKKGVKRSAAAANGNGEPKVRGKPGPKKKQRLEDGTIDNTARGAGLSAHKLGPKANQGAINAGLRALDRSGKPCRKWAKGSFTLKSFTGVIWDIPRWTAPPKTTAIAEDSNTSGAVSAEGSSKENGKEHVNGNGHLQLPPLRSEASGNGVDVEMQSVSPAPQVAMAA